MRPIHLLAALAAWGFAQAASAAPVAIAPVAVAPALETKFRDDYGPRESEYLVRETTDEVTEALMHAGATVERDARVRVEITLVDAKPNRPTFAQMGRPPFIDFSSISIGGAELHAVFRSADGRTLSEVSYKYYDPRLDEFSQANSTWTTARRAIDSFARRVAEAYRANVASS
ncbi:MAG TPA: hypothetical protein VG943_03370 [Caulobacterales bacterium]|nr:hypothetical protein [Caulobacterales bacterium]